MSNGKKEILNCFALFDLPKSVHIYLHMSHNFYIEDITTLPNEVPLG
jgi:hypothetical protein